MVTGVEISSSYENVVAERLRLKGKPLHVKTGNLLQKNKKHKKKHPSSYSSLDHCVTGGNTVLTADQTENLHEQGRDGIRRGTEYGHLTPAEKCYLQQWEKIDLQRMAKMACKSHRDRIQEFNQYLANLSEHHDIPKVGPG